MFKLRLYVQGKTKKSEKVAEDLKTLLEDELKGQYSLEIIDVFDKPQLADEDLVLATPTVVKIFPLPARKIIGDFSEKEKVLQGLGIK